MYFPKDYNFIEDMERGKYLKNVVECDQFENSPHLYVAEKQKVSGILVDAGVAEGNFALRYIDDVDKAYLIESDPRWLEVLRLTFAPYNEKVIFIDKQLGKRNNDIEVTLDTIIGDGVCDFIKMDIEGAEPDALLGAINVLKHNHPFLSVCAYHNIEDEKYIRFILNALGYTTDCSKGYMFYLYDENIDLHLDFRHGIIYGRK